MEESFDPIAQTRANYYTPGSPVQFVRVELLKGSVSGDRAVCLTFKNVSQANLTALDIFFRCKGAGGSILCEADFAYRDLDVKPGELFGMDDAVFVTDKAINSVDVSLKRVCKGRQAISLEKIKRVRLPAPRPLSAEMEAALEERMSRKGLKFAPQVLDCGWYCACGAFHPKEEDTVYCSECGCDRILLQNAMNTLMQPEAAEPQAAPAEQTRVVGGFAGTPAPETKPSQEGTRAFPVPGKTVPAPKEEPTRVVNPSARPADPLPDGTRAFVLPQEKPEARPSFAEDSGSTRVVGGASPVEEDASARQSWRSRSEPEPRRPRTRIADLYEEEEEEDDEPEDAVAETIIRWIPPLTALICAGIALSGFVYYQFFL
ncbi:MAG: hypothetical protein H9864_01195 [Candidatus Faecalibacterium intestinavium]|uniref:Uncharacterized protein n=1 Tax=Candidatus Faecalibacterium intestinavium TaxID=2838580 RepID=A0A9E2NPZ6_9FIRM|nr:hypothetical protein [Candidatus Faecalibacterium intestinavium]